MAEKDVMKNGKPIAKIFTETPEAKQRRALIEKVNNLEKDVEELKYTVSELVSKLG